MLWLLDGSPLRVVKAGRPAVVFFFVLSGSVLTFALLRQHEPVSPEIWVARRTLRLLPPVTASVLLSAALCWWLSAGQPPDGLGLFVHVSWPGPPYLAFLSRHVALLLGAAFLLRSAAINAGAPERHTTTFSGSAPRSSCAPAGPRQHRGAS